MGISLMRRHRAVAILAVSAMALAALLLWLVAGGGGPASAQAATSHAKHHATHHASHHVSARHAQSPADGDTVQSGDQTSPDTPGASSAQSDGSESVGSETESSVESEQGLPGEPAVGHEDPAGAAGPDCTGGCVQ